MGRILGGIAGVLVLAAGITAIYVYTQVNSLEVTRVTDDVHMISGLGSNVGVLTTEKGAVIVDTMTFVAQGRQVLDLADNLAGPPRAIINTHYHLDHTHGNPAFPGGMKVIATERTRAYLDHFDGDYWTGPGAGTVPNDLFADRHELVDGGKTIRSFHLGRGHTGGDLVVLFVEDRVLHTGDLFFNGRYPNIDLEAGGSVREWGATIDRVLELDFDKVIPGHGPVTDRAGLIAFQGFIRELAQQAGDAVANGLSLEQTLDTVDLQTDEGFDVMSIPFVMRLDRDFVVKRAWEEASGAVAPVDVGNAGS